MTVLGWIAWAAYAFLAVSTVILSFKQNPFVVFLAVCFLFIAIPLRWYGLIALSWWLIFLAPIIVALCYGRLIGFLQNRSANQ